MSRLFSSVRVPEMRFREIRSTDEIRASRMACAWLACIVIFAQVSRTLAAVGGPAPSTGNQDNHNLLSGLGLARLPSVTAARLAPKHRFIPADDSKMFVIQLPPSQHYYSFSKPTGYYQHAAPNPNSLSKVGVGFRSNGKPSKVYHWNIPVLERIGKYHPTPAPKRPRKGGNNRRHIASPASTAAPAGTPPFFYVPTPKKSSMHKVFAGNGNGKPHSVYVLEKSKKAKPVYFQRLLP